MPELANIETTHFECVIWAKDIINSRQRLQQTMSARNKIIPGSTICFNPPVTLLSCNEIREICDYKEALFFENKLYDIEFVFDESLKEIFLQAPPKVIHRLKNVEDAFHYNQRSRSLRASINTGNDIGWFRLELQYQVEQKLFKQVISFEVLPTKIDMASDVNQMNKMIDAEYPLWRFTLAEKTQHQLATVKKPQPPFLLLWLAQFERLRCDFEKGLKHIVNAPHSRLLGIEIFLKADKLKGKLNSKLELAVKQAQRNGLSNKRFLVKKKRLSVDTPENRFIKSVIETSINKFLTIAQIAKAGNANQYESDTQRLSDSFFGQLKNWQNSLRKFQHHSLFHEVGDYKGLTRESLVLQQKPGYAKVYRVWQELKYYLELLGDASSLSFRNVAELYEVWCFLEVRNIVLKLGFKEIENKKAKLVNHGLGVNMKDGLAGAFVFERADGIRLRLAHEPRFDKNNTIIKTWTTPQKPDILLEAKFVDGSELIWLFDAKYRIELKEDRDLVPDDAINQLHRYRDALIHQRKVSSGTIEKTRPVFGAYALYPGFYRQTEETNPYQDEIEEVGIGAFSLLPSDDQTGSYWLNVFLEQKLGPKQKTYVEAGTERYFIEEAVRIPYKGTVTSLYTDLTIIVNGMITGRTDLYRNNLEQGNTQYYHMEVRASDRQQIEQHVIKEVRYLAIAVAVSTSKKHEIIYLYPVINVTKKRRVELSEEQTGTKKIKQPDDLYWLFTLGKSIKLNKPLEKSFSRKFVVKLTSATALINGICWLDLPFRYEMLNED